jgi:hypothetical protein
MWLPKVLGEDTVRRGFWLTLTLSCGLAGTAAAAPQWQSGGLLVSGVPGVQTVPVITDDGIGGAYVAWFETRNGSDDVYLQRVASTGSVAVGWPLDGLGVCTAPERQIVSSLTPDGSGGVYVAWTDFRDRPANNADVYVQRMLATGVVAEGWPPNGLAVASMPGVQQLARTAPDGAGGVYLAWDDERSGGSTTADVYLLRVTPAGEVAAGWPLGGMNVSTAPGAQLAPALAADGQGGVFVAWGDTRDFATTATDVYASRVSASGALLPGWNPDGNPVSTAPGVQGIRAICRDGGNGIYVAWVDWRTAPPEDPFGSPYADIYLHHVSGAGSVEPGWPAQGLPVCTAIFLQQSVRLVADGTGGALLCWEDYRSLETADVYAQRVTAAGGLAPGWPPGGVQASTAAGYRYDPVLAPDGLGGAYLAFVSAEEFPLIYAQHLTAGGNPAPGWPAEGLVVAPEGGYQFDPALAADGGGGAIVGWEDQRIGAQGIYVHRLGPMGPTPVLVSLVSARAEPGRVRLEWYAAEGAGLAGTVERRTMASEWQGIGEARADGTGRVVHEDRAVTAGERYAYRLRYADGAAEVYTTEAWVEVPTLRFALHGLTPNPSAGDPVIRFTLPGDARATLELYDVGGRQIVAREVGALGAGTHQVRLAPPGRLAAGVYAVRLRRGTEAATARAVIVR